MKRAILPAIGAVAVAMAAIPALVAAQGAPPGIPHTFYGTVPSGVGPGQTVLAIVTSAGSSQTCGDGVTMNFEGQVVYVVKVASDSQRAGCGAPGKEVQFYFVGARQMATDTATWGDPQTITLKNLTSLGPQLTPKNIAPQIAKDGTN